MMAKGAKLKRALEKVFCVQKQFEQDDLSGIVNNALTNEMVRHDRFEELYKILTNNQSYEHETDIVIDLLRSGELDINKDDGTLLEECIINSSKQVIYELLEFSLRRGKNPISIRKAAVLRGDEGIKSMVYKRFTKQDADIYSQAVVVDGEAMESVVYPKDDKVSSDILAEQSEYRVAKHFGLV